MSKKIFLLLLLALAGLAAVFPVHAQLAAETASAVDYALATGTWGVFDANWEKNQVSQKPENYDYLLSFGQTYFYHPSAGNSVAYYAFSQYTVTDMQEAKAMVARSRTHAVGAQGGVGGVISSSVDLFSIFQFGNTREEHSAQFSRPIQTSLSYYRQMLRSYNIPLP